MAPERVTNDPCPDAVLITAENAGLLSVYKDILRRETGKESCRNAAPQLYVVWQEERL